MHDVSPQTSSRVLSASISPREAHFDPSIGAWIISRYADVSAALRHPYLAAPGTTVVGDETHRIIRAATTGTLTPDRTATWRTSIDVDAALIVDALAENEPVDLVRSFAEPWSLAVARAVTGASAARAAEAAPLARELFLVAAHATDGLPTAAALQSADRLARTLERDTPHVGALADVQVFVALSQTLPCLLAGTWLALLQHPEALLRLRHGTPAMTQAVEELLRYATPSRAVFRAALGDVDIGGANVRHGDQVVLMLAAANHDSAQFPDPDRLELERASGGHLAFGAGSHSCAGAAMVRMAVAVATGVLLRKTAAIELIGGEGNGIEWMDGFAIRAPTNLPVRLRRT